MVMYLQHATRDNLGYNVNNARMLSLYLTNYPATRISACGFRSGADYLNWGVTREMTMIRSPPGSEGDQGRARHGWPSLRRSKALRHDDNGSQRESKTMTTTEGGSRGGEQRGKR